MENMKLLKILTHMYKMRRTIIRLDRRLISANRKVEYLSQQYDNLYQEYSSVLGKIFFFIQRVKNKLKRMFLSKKDISDSVQNTSAEKTAVEKTKEVTSIGYKESSELMELERLIEITKQQIENGIDSINWSLLEKEENSDCLPIMKDPVKMDDVYLFNWQERYLELRDQICDLNYIKKVEPLVKQMKNQVEICFMDDVYQWICSL